MRSSCSHRGRGRPPRPPRLLELERYYEDILGAVRTPIHLSNEWFMVGYTVPAELLAAAAADNDHVTAINTSDPDLTVVAELLEPVDGSVPVHVGLLPQLPTALTLGATGPLGFEATIAPELCLGMLDAFDESRVADFSAAFRKVLALHRGLMRYRNPRSVKAALASVGLPAGAMRRPYLPLAPAETAEIEKLLRELGLARRLSLASAILPRRNSQSEESLSYVGPSARSSQQGCAAFGLRRRASGLRRRACRRPWSLGRGPRSGRAGGGREPRRSCGSAKMSVNEGVDLA